MNFYLGLLLVSVVAVFVGTFLLFVLERRRCETDTQ